MQIGDRKLFDDSGERTEKLRGEPAFRYITECRRSY